VVVLTAVLRRAIAVFVMVMASAACSADNAGDRPGGPDEASATDCPHHPPSEPLTVTAAKTTRDTCSWVRGFLYVSGRVQLCQALGESDPPSCGDGLTVSRIDRRTIPELQTRRVFAPAAGADVTVDTGRRISWSSDEVVVYGDVDDGVLTVRGESPVRATRGG
jgi:hypothetical protein